jgi:hypothetical protein
MLACPLWPNLNTFFSKKETELWGYISDNRKCLDSIWAAHIEIQRVICLSWDVSDLGSRYKSMPTKITFFSSIHTSDRRNANLLSLDFCLFPLFTLFHEGIFVFFKHKALPDFFEEFNKGTDLSPCLHFSLYIRSLLNKNLRRKSMFFTSSTLLLLTSRLLKHL